MLDFALCSSSIANAFLRLAPAVKLIDAPTARGLHEAPTIVGGGIVPIAIMASFLALSGALPFATTIAAMMAGLAVVGLLDDRWSIPTLIRLVCYLGAGLALPTMVVPSETMPLAVLLMLGVGVAWCINLVNFMDGADGLVVLQSLSVAVGLGLIATLRRNGRSRGCSAQFTPGLCVALFACLLLLFFVAARDLWVMRAPPVGFYLALWLVAPYIDPALDGLAGTHDALGSTVDPLCIRLLRGMRAYRPRIMPIAPTLRAGSSSVILGLLAMQVAGSSCHGDDCLLVLLLVLLSAIPALIVVVYARLSA